MESDDPSDGEQTGALLMQRSQRVGGVCDGCHSTSQRLDVLFRLNTEGVQLEPVETAKSGAVFMVGGLTGDWQSTDC